MPKGRDRLLPISGQEAARYGAIVTFRNAHGESWQWTRSGPITEVLQDACDAALIRDPTNLVVCISTPASIYADMAGRPGGAANGYVQNTEIAQLSRAGRRHMAHPILKGTFSL